MVIVGRGLTNGLGFVERIVRLGLTLTGFFTVVTSVAVRFPRGLFLTCDDVLPLLDCTSTCEGDLVLAALLVSIP